MPWHPAVRAGRPGRRTGTALAVLGGIMMLLAGCVGIPVDTAGTSERISGGEIRIGITHNPPWTDTSSSGPVTGTEVQLMIEFAESMDADIDWIEGSEGVLTDALREGAIDVAIGGFTDDTPWIDRAAVSDAYREVRNDRGVVEKHVVLTRLGENRLLVQLEAFLRENGSGR